MDNSIAYSSEYILFKYAYKVKKFLGGNFSFLVILLLILSFAISLSLFTINSNKSIQFIEKEQLGLNIHKILFKLSIAIQQAQRSKGGKLEGSTLDSYIKQIDGLDREMDAIGVLNKWSRTKKLLINTFINPTSTDQTKAKLALSQLMSETATQSNLILDPERNSYYLINLMVLVLPNMEDALDSIYNNLAIILADKQFTVHEAQNILARNGELTKWITFYAYAANIISEKVPQSVVDYVQKGLSSLRETNLSITEAINNINAYKQNTVSVEVTNSIAILAHIYNKLAQQLDWDLQKRIEQYKFYRLIMLLALLLAMTLSLAVFVYARKYWLNQEEVERAAFTNAILSTVKDGIITINPKGIIENFNPSAEQIFGYKSDEIIGKNINLLMVTPCHPSDDNYWQSLNKVRGSHEAKLSSEVRARHKDGSLFTIDLDVGIFSVNEKQMVVASIHDITQRKEEEQMKNEFISIASHELRTPITSIRGSLDLVLGLYGNEVPAKVRKLFHIAHENSKCLIVLINDILDIDKISSGLMKFNLEKLDLKEITPNVVEVNKAYAQRFNTVINLNPIPEDLIIAIDSSRYTQVLSNLLSNAAKFSKPNGVIDVIITATPDKVRISIRDYGCGISQEFKSRIFGKFSQENTSLAREKGGSGLGLNISKQIVERMNGSIGFETQLNEGTTFWIEFPRAV